MPNVNRSAPNENHVQSVLFYKIAGWTVASSRKWVTDHDYFTDGLDETETQFRWRQYDQDKNKFNYRSQVIKPNSIALILGFPK